MKVAFDENFYKKLAKIKDKPLLEKVKKIIIVAEAAGALNQIPHIKKLEGFKSYYRIRLGDYRIGAELQGDVFVFVTIGSRKDIYKFFS